MKLYAAAIAVYKETDNGFRSISFPIILPAVSKSEAIGKGIECALAEYPTEERWYSHQCSVVEITKDLMTKMLSAETVELSQPTEQTGARTINQAR